MSVYQTMQKLNNNNENEKIENRKLRERKENLHENEKK